MNLDDVLNKIKESISELEKEIEIRVSDEWQEKDRIDEDGHTMDTNGYFWCHCGEAEHYEGMLSGLNQSLNIINDMKNLIE